MEWVLLPEHLAIAGSTVRLRFRLQMTADAIVTVPQLYMCTAPHVQCILLSPLFSGDPLLSPLGGASPQAAEEASNWAAVVARSNKTGAWSTVYQAVVWTPPLAMAEPLSSVWIVVRVSFFLERQLFYTSASAPLSIKREADLISLSLARVLLACVGATLILFLTLMFGCVFTHRNHPLFLSSSLPHHSNSPDSSPDVRPGSRRSGNDARGEGEHGSLFSTPAPACATLLSLGFAIVLLPLLWLVLDPGQWSCRGRGWVLSLSFSLVVGPLFAASLSNGKRKRGMKICYLLCTLILLLALDLAVLLAWTVLEAPSLTTLPTLSPSPPLPPSSPSSAPSSRSLGRSHAPLAWVGTQVICPSSSLALPFSAALLVIKIAVLCAAAVARQRHAVRASVYANSPAGFLLPALTVTAALMLVAVLLAPVWVMWGLPDGSGLVMLLRGLLLGETVLACTVFLHLPAVLALWHNSRQLKSHLLRLRTQEGPYQKGLPRLPTMLNLRAPVSSNIDSYLERQRRHSVDVGIKDLGWLRDPHNTRPSFIGMQRHAYDRATMQRKDQVRREAEGLPANLWEDDAWFGPQEREIMVRTGELSKGKVLPTLEEGEEQTPGRDVQTGERVRPRNCDPGIENHVRVLIKKARELDLATPRSLREMRSAARHLARFMAENAQHHEPTFEPATSPVELSTAPRSKFSVGHASSTPPRQLSADVDADQPITPARPRNTSLSPRMQREMRQLARRGRTRR